MDNYHDFTFDSKAFAGLDEFSQKIRNEKGMKLIPIIDSGLSNDGGKDPYVAEAMDQNLLLKDGNETFFAQVWPHDAAFLDWFQPQS